MNDTIQLPKQYIHILRKYNLKYGTLIEFIERCFEASGLECQLESDLAISKMIVLYKEEINVVNIDISCPMKDLVHRVIEISVNQQQDSFGYSYSDSNGPISNVISLGYRKKRNETENGMMGCLHGIECVFPNSSVSFILNPTNHFASLLNKVGEDFFLRLLLDSILLFPIMNNDGNHSSSYFQVCGPNFHQMVSTFHRKQISSSTFFTKRRSITNHHFGYSSPQFDCNIFKDSLRFFPTHDKFPIPILQRLANNNKTRNNNESDKKEYLDPVISLSNYIFPLPIISSPKLLSIFRNMLVKYLKIDFKRLLGVHCPLPEPFNKRMNKKKKSKSIFKPPFSDLRHIVEFDNESKSNGSEDCGVVESKYENFLEDFGDENEIPFSQEDQLLFQSPFNQLNSLPTLNETTIMEEEDEEVRFIESNNDDNIKSSGLNSIPHRDIIISSPSREILKKNKKKKKRKRMEKKREKQITRDKSQTSKSSSGPILLPSLSTPPSKVCQFVISSILCLFRSENNKDAIFKSRREKNKLLKHVRRWIESGGKRSCEIQLIVEDILNSRRGGKCKTNDWLDELVNLNFHLVNGNDEEEEEEGLSQDDEPLSQISEQDMNDDEGSLCSDLMGLSPSRTSKTHHHHHQRIESKETLRKVILGYWIIFFFQDVALPILSRFFHISRVEWGSANTSSKDVLSKRARLCCDARLGFFRKVVWNAIHQEGEDLLLSSHQFIVDPQFSSVSASDDLGGNGNLNFTLGKKNDKNEIRIEQLPRLRLLPKTSSIRPIVDLKKQDESSSKGYRNWKKSSVLSNHDLAPIHILLKNQIEKNPSLIGFGLYSLEDIYLRFKHFLSNSAPNHPDTTKRRRAKIFFVSFDIEKCFDRIHQSLLYSIVFPLLSSSSSSSNGDNLVDSDLSNIMRSNGEEGMVLGDDPCFCDDEEEITRTLVSHPLPSLDRYGIGIIKTPSSLSTFTPFLSSLSDHLPNYKNAIFCDGVTRSIVKKSNCLEKVKTHLFEHRVVLPSPQQQAHQKKTRISSNEENQQKEEEDMVLHQISGVPQGSVLSPIFTHLYYGRYEMDLLFPHCSPSIMGMRYMDDYLIVGRVNEDGENENHVKLQMRDVLQAAYTKIGDIGGGINPDKTKSTIPLTIELCGSSIPLSPLHDEEEEKEEEGRLEWWGDGWDKKWFSWCGLLIHPPSHQFRVDHSRLFSHPIIPPSLSLKPTININKEDDLISTNDNNLLIWNKMKELQIFFIRAKAYKILFDCETINDLETVERNFAELIILSAMRMVGLVRRGVEDGFLMLEDGEGIGGDVSQFLSICSNSVHYLSNLIISKLSSLTPSSLPNHLSLWSSQDHQQTSLDGKNVQWGVEGNLSHETIFKERRKRFKQIALYSEYLVLKQVRIGPIIVIRLIKNIIKKLERKDFCWRELDQRVKNGIEESVDCFTKEIIW